VGSFLPERRHHQLLLILSNCLPTVPNHPHHHSPQFHGRVPSASVEVHLPGWDCGITERVPTRSLETNRAYILATYCPNAIAPAPTTRLEALGASRETNQKIQQKQRNRIIVCNLVCNFSHILEVAPMGRFRAIFSNRGSAI